MSTKPDKPKLADLRPRITVIGVGGAGCNAINNMIASGLTGVDFVAANTDAQALQVSSAEHRLQLGVNLTEGLGAGSKPEIGEAAAEEAIEDIRKQIAGSHMVFIACGMGGGTGTGAAAVLARTARELGILTVGVVTKPFLFEGARRMRVAEAGVVELKKQVDTLIVIPNQNLFRIANEKTTFAEAFLLADQVLYSGVACIVDLILKEGLINLDFADVRTVMSGMGTAMMGTGEAAGERRAVEAAEEAISNPLLDDVTLKGAKGLLLSITGGSSLTLYEVDAAASRVRQEVDQEANIIVGATFDSKLDDRVRVSIVASGMARLSEPAPPTHGSAEIWPRKTSRTAGAHGADAPPEQHAGSRAAEDDVARRLSEALQYDSPGDLYGDPYADDRSAARGTSQTWRAPGDVTIEESVPPLPPRGIGSGYDNSRQGSHPHHGTEFNPAPPVDARRQRRMPEVGDFPIIGQREYLAKSAPAQPRREPQQSASGNSAHEGSRRGGLFGWFGRRTSDSGDSQAPSASAPGPQPPHAAYGESSRAPSKGTRGQPPHAPSHGIEEVELPVILSRERK